MQPSLDCISGSWTAEIFAAAHVRADLPAAPSHMCVGHAPVVEILLRYPPRTPCHAPLWRITRDYVHG